MRRQRQRHAASGMIEVLILVSVAVVGAGALVAWFSGAHDVLQEGAECTAWIATHEISDNTYWAQATIRNTGDHPIREYHVTTGANDTPAASSHEVWEPGQTAILEFVVTGVGEESNLLPARVIGRGAGGSALCEVVTP